VDINKMLTQMRISAANILLGVPATHRTTMPPRGKANSLPRW